jgi:hypothetical protein
MKIRILLVFLMLVPAVIMSGQKELPEFRGNQRHDTTLQDRINRKSDLFRYKEIMPQFNLKPGKDFEQNNQRPHSRGAEEYPGSSRYYAQKISPYPFSYGESFIIKPDTSAKYYLIIKDPLQKTIRR